VRRSSARHDCNPLPLRSIITAKRFGFEVASEVVEKATHRRPGNTEVDEPVEETPEDAQGRPVDPAQTATSPRRGTA
jgi:hypothetical protein